MNKTETPTQHGKQIVKELTNLLNVLEDNKEITVTKVSLKNGRLNRYKVKGKASEVLVRKKRPKKW